MGRYATAARKAAELTNKQLGTEIASLGPVDRDRLQTLLPQKRDKEAFLALMKQVEAERERDENLAYLNENLQSVGEVVFKILKFFT